MLPFLQVGHLPSASSFYSAVTQPLGLRFISASAASSPPSVTYGTATFPPVPVFEVRQATEAPGQPFRRSHVVFAAPSSEAVREFAACGQRAKEGSTSLSLRQSLGPDDFRGGGGSSGELPPGPGSYDSGETSAKITDFDGNIMDVVYVPPQDYSSRYSGSTLRKTQSTHDEVSRILHWNYDIASTDAAPSPSPAPEARRPGRFPDDDSYAPILRRSVTTTSITSLEPATPAAPLTPLTPGLSVVGTLLGVAAGAAIGAGITYGVMSKDREFEAPMFQRRSTEPYPDRYGRYPDAASRSVKQLEYPDQYTAVADRRPPPTVMTRYTQATVPRSSREVDDDDDGRSRHSSRYRPSNGGGSVRTHSEVTTTRKPLLLTDVEHRSYVSTGSRHSAKTSEIEEMMDQGSYTSSRRSSGSKPKSYYSTTTVTATPPMRRSSTFDTADRESYVSARSHRTASTVRGPPAPSAQTVLSLRPASKPASRVTTTTTVKVPPRSSVSRSQSYMSTPRDPPPQSRTATRVSTRAPSGTSRISARNLGLPASGAGSSHADWDEDDGDSIAPSDSISCVGSRRSARLYH